MSRFKIGDRVRVLEDKAYFAAVNRGDCGVVTKLKDKDDDYTVKMENEREWYFKDEHIELVPRSVDLEDDDDLPDYQEAHTIPHGAPFPVPVQADDEDPVALPLSLASAGKPGARGILEEAAAIVSGDRNETHGEAERSFKVIASFWDAYVTHSGLAERKFEADDVANMLVLLKMARAISGQPVRDHFVDMAGYAALAGEIAGALG